MNLHKATIQDTPEVMQLIRSTIIEMRNNGIDQWGDFYPTEKIIRKDVEKQHLYMYKQESHLIGIVALENTQDPEYDKLQWQGDGNFLVVHRLAIDPAFQRQGCATKIMDWVETFASTNGYTSIRLDAYTGNPAAVNLYERRGYSKTGQVCYPHRTLPFNCYEK